MANNSNRKAIEFMVQGALPPHSTNVLWMDTSVPTLPVLKIFENGAWTTVHTEQSKIDELLAKTVLEQAEVINKLTDNIEVKVDGVTNDLDTLQQTVSKISQAVGAGGTARLRPLIGIKGFPSKQTGEGSTDDAYFFGETETQGEIIYYDETDSPNSYSELSTYQGWEVIEGTKYYFPFNPELGVGIYYNQPEVSKWYVPTTVPADINNLIIVDGDKKYWNREALTLVEVTPGMTIKCVKEEKYYLPNNEYLGSIFLYEVVAI